MGMLSFPRTDHYLYHDWNYTGIVNPEKNEENDEENTDDEDFVRASSNSNECDDVIVLNIALRINVVINVVVDITKIKYLG